MRRVVLRRSDRLYVPWHVDQAVLDELRDRCTYPDHVAVTYVERPGGLGMPLGVGEFVESTLRRAGYDVEIARDDDRAPRLEVRAIPDKDLRPPQSRFRAMVHVHDCGVSRIATGVGKTRAVAAAIAMLGGPCLVLVPDVALALQWHAALVHLLGCEVAVVGGGTRQVGPVCIAAPDLPDQDPRVLRALQRIRWDAVFVDEAQHAGTPRTLRLLERLAPRRLYGLSDDERRDDGRSDLAADWLGPVRMVVTRDEAVDAGWIVPVDVLLWPTSHGSRMTGSPPSSGQDFDRMLRAMAADETREIEVDAAVAHLLTEGYTPTMVVSHRRDHARAVADRWRSGKLLGGAQDRPEFRRVLADLRAGTTEVAAGTIQSVGVGQDVQALRGIVAATPFGRRWRRGFSQLIGRACRTAPGKERGILVVLEDWRLYRYQVEERVLSWTTETTEVRRFEAGREVVVRAARSR